MGVSANNNIWQRFFSPISNMNNNFEFKEYGLFKDNSKENKIKLIYKFDEPGEKIRLIGSKFFVNNKNNCKMVINFEEKELLEFYESKKMKSF